MKAFALICGVCMSCWSFAQTTFQNIYDSVNTYNSIEVFGNFDAYGTSMRRGFYGPLAFGGEITDEVKDKTFAAHGFNNRFGIYATGEINYFNGVKPIFKNKNWAWNIKAGYYVSGNINYTKDGFRLLFYGNGDYENDTANLTGTRVRMTQFQKVGFGLNHVTKRFGITLNVVNVQNDFNVYVNRGKWIGTNNASVVEIDLHGDAYYTQTKLSNGIGFALDAYYNFTVPWGKSTAVFRAEIQNLGAAYIFNQYHYNVDSNYYYSGFTLGQLTGGAKLPNTTERWMDTLGVQKDSLGRWTMLPTYFQAMKVVDYNSSKKVQSFFGFRFYPTLGTVPTAFAGVFYRFKPRWSVSANGTFGGSADFRAGLNVGYLGSTFRIQVGTDDVFGALSKSGFGSSIMGRIVWNLKK